MSLSERTYRLSRSNEPEPKRDDTPEALGEEETAVYSWDEVANILGANASESTECEPTEAEKEKRDKLRYREPIQAIWLFVHLIVVAAVIAGAIWLPEILGAIIAK